MKKVLVIVLLTLSLVISFVSCGSKSEDILSKALDYAKEEKLEWLQFEIAYDDCTDVEDFEELLSEYGVHGMLTMYAFVESSDFDSVILEFENADDAKEAQEDFKADEWKEEWGLDGAYIVVRKGNTVVFGKKDFVKYITK